MPEDYKSGQFEDRLVLSKEKFSESIVYRSLHIISIPTKKLSIYRPGRLGRAKPRAAPWFCGGFTSSCNRSAVISSGDEASICDSVLAQLCPLHSPRITSNYTFFSIFRPSFSAIVIAVLRELACTIRSLIEDPLGQVYTNTTTSVPG